MCKIYKLLIAVFLLLSFSFLGAQDDVVDTTSVDAESVESSDSAEIISDESEDSSNNENSTAKVDESSKSETEVVSEDKETVVSVDNNSPKTESNVKPKVENNNSQKTTSNDSETYLLDVTSQELYDKRIPGKVFSKKKEITAVNSSDDSSKDESKSKNDKQKNTSDSKVPFWASESFAITVVLGIVLFTVILYFRKNRRKKRRVFSVKRR